jgi:hypothetical protein
MTNFTTAANVTSVMQAECTPATLNECLKEKPRQRSQAGNLRSRFLHQFDPTPECSIGSFKLVKLLKLNLRVRLLECGWRSLVLG